MQLNLNSDRAKLARLADILEKATWRWTLCLLALNFGLAGAWLVIMADQAWGYLLLGLIGPIIMPLFWYAGQLRDLPATTSLELATDLSQVLERQLLAQLSQSVTPRQLAKLVESRRGGQFFAIRYGLMNDLLVSLCSDDPGDMAVIWSEAQRLAQSDHNVMIDSAAVTAALILTIPNIDHVLAAGQADKAAIVDGYNWYQRIHQIIKYYGERRHFGGIGRDLSFGWAPVLNRVGLNLTDSITRGNLIRTPPSRHQLIGQIVYTLSQSAHGNVALVGEVGAGKTSLAQAVAQHLLQSQHLPPNLRYNQVISLNAATLISQASQPGELEGLLIHLFNEAINAKNVILFLDEAQLFLRDGTGSVDLSSLLLPVLSGGRVRLILAMTNQEWLRLAQANPGLAQLLNRIVLPPLEQAETMTLIQEEVLLFETRHNVFYMYQSLQEAYRLAERFIHEQVMPGKAVKLLEAAAGYPEEQYYITSTSVQRAVEQSFGVRVQTADTSAERDQLLNLEQLIHERMINQTRAVRLVSDALRRARAGVRNQNRPIGTFLFLGPTGVGKTELSKSLAAVYFGGEDHLLRLDLNEYSQPSDTTRLLATGATDPYSLCAQILKQPFSVVLLDEIEKAHPNVLNLLLQMLDEGILRDAQNRPVSFRDAIIIATSNAGADKIRQHIDRGEQLEQFETAFVDELIDANIFRPEFLNRFDEIVLFRPLEKTELLQVVDLLVVGLNKTLANRKVTVSLTPAAKELLVQTGYDPRLGARPLRRVVQRAVENVVAHRLLAGTISPGQVLELDAPELQATLQDRMGK